MKNSKPCFTECLNLIAEIKRNGDPHNYLEGREVWWLIDQLDDREVEEWIHQLVTSDQMMGSEWLTLCDIAFKKKQGETWTRKQKNFAVMHIADNWDYLSSLWGI